MYIDSVVNLNYQHLGKHRQRVDRESTLQGAVIDRESRVIDSEAILLQNMFLLPRAAIWLLAVLVGRAVEGSKVEGRAVENRSVMGRNVLSCLQCSDTMASPDVACKEGSQEVGRAECGKGAQGCYAQFVKVTCGRWGGGT